MKLIKIIEFLEFKVKGKLFDFVKKHEKVTQKYKNKKAD